MSNRQNLVKIPKKHYFTIAEICDLCQLKSHILRRWEQEFPVLGSMKRRGSHRYYQRKDVLLIQRIRELLYNKGYTIAEAKKRLKFNTKKRKKIIHQSIQELEEILLLLNQ